MSAVNTKLMPRIRLQKKKSCGYPRIYLLNNSCEKKLVKYSTASTEKFSIQKQCGTYRDQKNKKKY